MPESSPQNDPGASAAEVFKTFLKLGLTSFGGPIAHLGYFRRELVERRRWVSEDQYGQLLAVCQFLPGPASSQLGFTLGLLRAGWLGAVAAFAAFTLPSALLLLCFAAALEHLSGPVAGAAVHGLKLVACAVVADAVLGMARNLCPDTIRRSIAVAAAGVLLLVGSAWSQILVVVGGAFAGAMLCQTTSTGNEAHIQVPYGKRTGGLFFVLFAALFGALELAASTQADLAAVAEAFYRAGALVFGGGHVVLPLLEDSVVGAGWVSRDAFLAGYGAAQAVPGPLFSFSAYLGALIPVDQGWGAGASVALLCMFLPGFLLVAAVLPVWQAVASNPAAANSIAGVNAAVVGLLGAALYDPIFTSGIDSNADMAIVAIAFGMLTVWRLSPLYAVVWCVAARVALQLVTG